MAEIPKWKQEIARQVHSLLLDYPYSVLIFRKRARELCAEYQRHLDARDKVDTALIADEEFDSLVMGNCSQKVDPPETDETVLKTIPRDPIRGSEYYKEPATKSEELCEQYTALAVLHDSVLREELQSSVIILTDKSWACLMIQKSILGNKTDYDQKFYEDTLEAVKADIAEEAERESQQSKFGFHPKRPSE